MGWILGWVLIPSRKIKCKSKGIKASWLHGFFYIVCCIVALCDLLIKLKVKRYICATGKVGEICKTKKGLRFNRERLILRILTTEKNILLALRSTKHSSAGANPEMFDIFSKAENILMFTWGLGEPPPHQALTCCHQCRLVDTWV